MTATLNDLIRETRERYGFGSDSSAESITRQTMKDLRIAETSALTDADAGRLRQRLDHEWQQDEPAINSQG